MNFSRKWIWWTLAVPALGAASFGVWRFTQRAVATAPREFVSVSSKPGDPVSRVEQLTCELTQGWPVILVRDDNDRSPWWVQGKAERQDDHKFLARAHFGNETTEPGQRYQIVVLSATDETQARGFETGMMLDDIPQNLPRSEAIGVVRH